MDQISAISWSASSGVAMDCAACAKYRGPRAWGAHSGWINILNNVNNLQSYCVSNLIHIRMLAIVLPVLAANELLICFVTRGPITCLCTGALRNLAIRHCLLVRGAKSSDFTASAKGSFKPFCIKASWALAPRSAAEKSQRPYKIISSPNLAGGQYMASLGHPFYLRSKGQMSRSECQSSSFLVFSWFGEVGNFPKSTHESACHQIWCRAYFVVIVNCVQFYSTSFMGFDFVVRRNLPSP